MKSLKTLLRARRRILDEKRRDLTVLEEQADLLHDARAHLADARDREAENFRNSDNGGYGYGSFLAGTRLRDDALQRDLGELNVRIEAVRDEIAEAFEEIKRFELIEATQEERARKEAARREQLEMDELGLNVFRRGGAEA